MLKKTIYRIIVILLISVAICNAKDDNKAFEQKNKLKENFVFFNINISSIQGSLGENIKFYDKSPFAKLIYGGSLSYSKVLKAKYSIGTDFGYWMNNISDAHSKAISVAGNFSYYIKGYNFSGSYIKTELGYIKAFAKDNFIQSSADKISTKFTPFYKLAIGTHGPIGSFGSLKFEFFYNNILSKDKKISGIDNYTIESNLSTYGITIGTGLQW